MDPVTVGTQTAKALAEAQNVQQILAIMAGVLLSALILVCVLYRRETIDRREETKAHGEAMKAAEVERRVEVRGLLETMAARIERLALALDAEHDRSRAIGGPVGRDEPDGPNKSGARRRV